MLIYTYQKSKKKKKTKKQIAEYEAWLNSVKSQTTNFSKGVKSKKPLPAKTVPKLTYPPGREPQAIYPSVTTGGGSCTKPINGKVYTGSAMIGIGTLHKSNAVPIFNAEDALEQAKMRR
jgi:hypothetical protein